MEGKRGIVGGGRGLCRGEENTEKGNRKGEKIRDWPEMMMEKMCRRRDSREGKGRRKDRKNRGQKIRHTR